MRWVKTKAHKGTPHSNGRRFMYAKALCKCMCVVYLLWIAIVSMCCVSAAAAVAASCTFRHSYSARLASCIFPVCINNMQCEFCRNESEWQTNRAMNKRNERKRNDGMAVEADCHFFDGLHAISMWILPSSHRYRRFIHCRLHHTCTYYIWKRWNWTTTRIALKWDIPSTSLSPVFKRIFDTTNSVIRNASIILWFNWFIQCLISRSIHVNIFFVVRPGIIACVLYCSIIAQQQPVLFIHQFVRFKYSVTFVNSFSLHVLWKKEMKSRHITRLLVM